MFKPLVSPLTLVIPSFSCKILCPLFHLHHHFLHICFVGTLMPLHLLYMMWATSCTRTSWFRLDKFALLEWCFHFLCCTHWSPYACFIASLGSRSWQEVHNSLYLRMWLWHEGTEIAELFIHDFHMWNSHYRDLYFLIKKIAVWPLRKQYFHFDFFFNVLTTPFVVCWHFRVS